MTSRTSLRLSGIVLAAGSAKRFGEPKQLLPLGGTTLLGQVVANANASSLDRVVVVLGREANRIQASLDLGRARMVDNTIYSAGCASSLLAGLDASGDCDGVLLLLGDQPGVGSVIIDSIAAVWRAHRPWAVVTSYRDAVGHPFVFSREAFPDLRQLHGDKAVWKLIESHPEKVEREFVDALLPADVDTPEDYRKLLGTWRD